MADLKIHKRTVQDNELNQALHNTNISTVAATNDQQLVVIPIKQSDKQATESKAISNQDIQDIFGNHSIKLTTKQQEQVRQAVQRVLTPKPTELEKFLETFVVKGADIHTLEQKLRAIFDSEQENYDPFPIDARELHSFLEIGRDFSTWIKDTIKKYDFRETIDYETRSPKRGSEQHGGQNKIEYKITLNMAKEVAMLQRNDLGKLIRRYLIWCEEQLRKQEKQMDPTDLFYRSVMAMKAQKEHLERLEGRLTYLENNTDIHTPFSEVGYKFFQHDESLANHEKRITMLEVFEQDNGPAEEIQVLISDTKKKYDHLTYEDIWQEFYRVLRERYNIDINKRLSQLKKRRLEQGWSQSKVSKVSKLDAMTANPDIWKATRAMITQIRETWAQQEEEE